MKPKADNLFHFTKSLDILKSILQNGIQPKYCLEDFEWFGWDAHKYLAFPISCFCDIPLSRIKEHTDFYGNYGIGLSKEWGFTNRLAPVIYTPQDSDITRLALFMFGISDNTFTEKGKEEFNQLIFKFLSLVKPINGNIIISGETTKKEFYQENEWRYIANTNVMLYEKGFNESRKIADKALLNYTLEFTPKDIKYLFVKEESDIPALVDFINEKLGNYPHNDLKILSSKIVSLNSLSADL